MCGVLPSCSCESPRRGTQPGVSAGSGAQGAAGVWAANQSEGGTKVLGILDQGSLTRWTPPQRDALPFSQAWAGSWTREEPREQGRRARLPGSPEVLRLQRDVARCFHFFFSLLEVLEATCQQTYAPPLPPSQRVLLVRTQNKHTGGCGFFKTALRALRSVASVFPLSSRIVLLSSLLFLFLFFRDPRAVRTPLAGCGPLPAF